MPRMLRLLLIAFALAIPSVALAQDPTNDRIKALEAENRRLQEEVQALKQRLQQIEQGNAAPAATPASSDDPGADPWGNPAAIRRMLGEALRANLESKGLKVPDAQADGKAWATYRTEVDRWWKDLARQRRNRQTVTWKIDIQEVSVTSNTQVREYEIVAYALNDAGARVGKWFGIRCPASAVPNLDPAKARGAWVLKAEVMAEVRLSDDATPGAEGAQFHPRDTIAPQVDCSMRYSVTSLEPKPADGAPPAKGGKAR